MPKTRSLKDLYVVGKELELDDGQGSVTVWLQKLNPVDHETALRKANSRRARTLAMSRMPKDSEEREEYMNQLFDIAGDRDQTINFLAQERISERYSAIEAEIAAEDEWSKDDYIQGLKDAWDAELYEVYVTTSESERDDEKYLEAERVHSELARFTDQVAKIIDGELDSLRKDFEEFTEEKLIEKAVNKLIESQANMNWLIEMRKSEIWLGTRDNKNRERLFKERSEVDELPSEVIGALINGFNELNVDSTEGKD